MNGLIGLGKKCFERLLSQKFQSKKDTLKLKNQEQNKKVMIRNLNFLMKKCS